MDLPTPRMLGRMHQRTRMAALLDQHIKPVHEQTRAHRGTLSGSDPRHAASCRLVLSILQKGETGKAGMVDTDKTLCTNRDFY